MQTNETPAVPPWLMHDATAEHAFQHAAERYDAGDKQQAIELLAALLQRNPLHVGALKLFGYALYERDDRPLATNALLLATLLDADDPEPPFYAACCLLDGPDDALMTSLLRTSEAVSRTHPRHADIGDRAQQLLASPRNLPV